MELVKRDDITIVGVYSPDHPHVEHCLAPLNAGKHVICTKPMVTSIKDADRVVKLVDETGLKFLVETTCRFTPVFMAAKGLYDDGDLGEIIFAEAHYIHDIHPVFDRTLWRYEAPKTLCTEAHATQSTFSDGSPAT